MFKKNKYTHWYYNIINKARARTPNFYTETHHILPKSLGGNDDKSNQILSLDEYFQIGL